MLIKANLLMSIWQNPAVAAMVVAVTVVQVVVAVAVQASSINRYYKNACYLLR